MQNIIISDRNNSHAETKISDHKIPDQEIETQNLQNIKLKMNFQNIKSKYHVREKQIQRNEITRLETPDVDRE